MVYPKRPIAFSITQINIFTTKKIEKTANFLKKYKKESLMKEIRYLSDISPIRTPVFSYEQFFRLGLLRAFHPHSTRTRVSSFRFRHA